MNVQDFNSCHHQIGATDRVQGNPHQGLDGISFDSPNATGSRNRIPACCTQRGRRSLTRDLVFVLGCSLFGAWFSQDSWIVAGEYNQQLSIGDASPTWSGLPGVDGKEHDLDEWKDHQLVVIVFTCNSCPYALDAEDRLIALQKNYANKGVAVVAINVNTIEEDRLPAMKKRAAERGFPFAYLFDESQEIARKFGAMATPECYLLDQQRRVCYMGSIDDSPDGKQITQTYLADAIDSVLRGGEPEKAETVPIGCRVRYERVRRSRRSLPPTQ